MGKVKEMRLSVQSMLILMMSNMGMDTPQNIEEITDFVLEDVQETADPVEWHSGDVAIAFRRWIEAQGTQSDENPEPKPKTIGVIGLGDRINNISELRKLMSDLDANDLVCVQSIDLETGDAEDLYPMNLDVIEGIELSDKSIVREVRFCQMMNSAPDTRDKQPVIDALIAQTINDYTINDYNHGDTTVIDEILHKLPFETLLHSLPEDQWVKYRYQNVLHDGVLIPVNDEHIWGEIRDTYEDDDKIYIDAWVSADDNEEGKTIAKVDKVAKNVVYLDDRAKTNKYAQEVIQECLKRL